MGGSKSPQVIQPPAPPAPPTLGATIQDYVANYPQLVAQQQQYGPQLAQLDYDLYSQYAPQYSQVAADIDKQLYPQTAALQENLAGQAIQGMNEPVPAELKQQYLSDFNAGLGMNANAPIGVSDRSVALLQLQKQWGDYYRNLGLSVANRQPLQGPSNPTFQNPNQGVGDALGFASGNYQGQLSGYNSSLANRIIQPSSGGFSGIGGLAGAIGGNMLFPGVGGIIGGGLLGGFGR